MDTKIVLGENTGEKIERSIVISYRNIATLHHSFIGLIKQMWYAIKNRDKAPFKDMDIPEISLSNYKMKILENVKTWNDNNGGIIVVRFYVRNFFDHSNRTWFAFRDMTLRTFPPYSVDVKTAKYDFDTTWEWFRRVKVQDTKIYGHLYDEAQALTWYFNRCVCRFLYNDIHADKDLNAI